MVTSVLALLCLSQAHAGFLPLWEVDTWPEDADVAGKNDWVGGYEADPWRGSTGDAPREFLIPTTDDTEAAGKGFGDGGPSDNWLIHGAPFESGRVVAVVGNRDDDTMGLVLSHNGDATYYLALHSGGSNGSPGSRPPPLSGSRRPTVALVRIEKGKATVLAEANAASLGATPDTLSDLEFVRTGGRLLLSLDGEALLDEVDPKPLPEGRAGVYAYDNGDDQQNRVVFFDLVTAELFDGDDDGVADDIDNCPVNPNPLQVDNDDDGIGDPCDPTPGEPPVVDSGTDDTAVDTDGGSDTDLDIPGPPDLDPTAAEELVAACDGCASTGPGGAAWSLLLVGAAALRRRRARA